MAFDFDKFGETPQNQQTGNFDLDSFGTSSAPTHKVAPKQKNDVLNNPVTRGIQSFFPGKKVGEAIGTLGGYALSPNKSHYDLSAPSPLQVAGDVAQGAAQVAGFKGVGATGSFGAKALKSAGLGATMFGGKTAAEGGGAKDIAKSAAIGGAVGAGTSAVASGIETAAEQFKKLPERLIRSATGQSKREILAGKGLEKFMIENRKVGTADNLINESKAHMEKLSNYINDNLKSVPVTKAKVTTSSVLDKIVKDVNAQGGAITKAEARQIIDRLAPQSKGILSKPSMSLVTANKLRQSIDRTVGDRGFLTAELPFNKDILRSFTNALREEVKSKAPEGTRAAFNTLSKEITMSTALANKIAGGSTNQVISFGDLIGGGIGGLAGGIPGAAIGAAARRAIQSTPALTGGAVAIDALNKAIQPIIKGLSPAVQTEILNAISNVASPKESQRNQ